MGHVHPAVLLGISVLLSHFFCCCACLLAKFAGVCRGHFNLYFKNRSYEKMHF